MERDKPPERCRSGATGKYVDVRHARESDRLFMERMLGRYGFDGARVEWKKYVVAEEDGRLLGFGNARKTGMDGVQLSVFVEEGKEYLSELVIRHLLRSGP